MHTNHVTPEKHLLQHESFEQSLRFIVLGAWETSNSEITAQVRRIYDQCGLLFESLMGPGTKLDAMKDGVQAGTTARSSIVADTHHQKPSLYGRMLARTAKGIGLPVKEDDMKDPRYSAFYARLRQAYDRDYDKPSIILYGGKPLSWWNKASFTGLDSRSVFPLLALLYN